MQKATHLSEIDRQVTHDLDMVQHAVVHLGDHFNPMLSHFTWNHREFVKNRFGAKNIETATLVKYLFYILLHNSVHT